LIAYYKCILLRRKQNFHDEELNSILASSEFQEMKNIRIIGLMGMATFTDNQRSSKKKEFSNLKSDKLNHRKLKTAN
jgi:uncharacterized pyridoxal phosphate-containing UPF0001 family protein